MIEGKLTLRIGEPKSHFQNFLIESGLKKKKTNVIAGAAMFEKPFGLMTRVDEVRMEDISEGPIFFFRTRL